MEELHFKNGIICLIRTQNRGDKMEHQIILILGLAGIIITGAIAGILVLETTREKST